MVATGAGAEKWVGKGEILIKGCKFHIGGIIFSDLLQRMMKNNNALCVSKLLKEWILNVFTTKNEYVR
jgi:hypothetical protein